MINPSNKAWTDFFYEYGLYINRAAPPHMTENHSHYEIEILHMRRGSGRFIVGETEYLVDSSSFCLFWATTPHRLIEVEPNSEFYILMIPLLIFYQAEVERRLESMLISGHMINHLFESDVQQNMFYAYLDQWFEDKQRGAFHSSRELSTEFGALLRRMNLETDIDQVGEGKEEKVGEKRAQHELEQVRQILRFMVERFQEPLTAAQISQQVELHPDYASALFRRVMGKTFLQYLTEFRVQIAIGLLQNTSRSVLDIALDCGFRSSSQFYASFKKITEKSPKDYRK